MSCSVKAQGVADDPYDLESLGWNAVEVFWQNVLAYGIFAAEILPRKALAHDHRSGVRQAFAVFEVASAQQRNLECAEVSGIRSTNDRVLHGAAGEVRVFGKGKA